MQSQNTTSITEWYYKHHNKPITSISSVFSRPNMSIAEYAEYASKNYGVNTGKIRSTTGTIRKYIPSSKTLENVGIGLGTTAGTGLLAYNAAQLAYNAAHQWHIQKKTIQGITGVGKQNSKKEVGDNSDHAGENKETGNRKEKILFYIVTDNDDQKKHADNACKAIKNKLNTYSIDFKYNTDINFSNIDFDVYAAVYIVYAIDCSNFLIDSNDGDIRVVYLQRITNLLNHKTTTFVNILLVGYNYNNDAAYRNVIYMSINNQPSLKYWDEKQRHIKYIVPEDTQTQESKQNIVNQNNENMKLLEEQIDKILNN